MFSAAQLGPEFQTAAPGTLRLRPLPGFQDQVYIAPFVPGITPSRILP